MTEVHILHAFTKNETGGNPAGVMFAEDLTGAEMQRIAAEVGLSETAFIFQGNNEYDYRLRFFTPVSEVDLCGHATVAAFSYLRQYKQLKPGTYRIAAGAGLLEVRVDAEEMVYLTQAQPIFSEVLSREEAAASLGIAISDLDDTLPVQIVSTGLRDILIPVLSRRVLANCQPDMHKIAAVSNKHDAIGYHVFTLDTDVPYTASCRNFAPLHGIPEESATGTASGALASYLQHYQKLGGNNHALFEQGEAMNQLSEIHTMLTISKDQSVSSIQVGGRASFVETRMI